MERVVNWVKGFALTLGGPGLFLIAFLDSSLLSFPEVVDLLLMGLVIQHKERVLYYALLSTLGSIAGCFVLYGLAWKGGEAFLRRRFAGHHIDRALRLFQKYGLLAVAIPSILPPPVPFKIFVFAAGVARVPPLRFFVAVALGRGRPLLRGGLPGPVVRRGGDRLPEVECANRRLHARRRGARRRCDLDLAPEAVARRER